jgi:DNA-binding protein HU-beta
MNTTELIAKLTEAHSVSKAQAKSIVDDILKNIVDTAASGAEVSLPGFGKFKVKATPEREGRNPASGEKIKIAASRKLTFSSAKPIKDRLNGCAELRPSG